MCGFCGKLGTTEASALVDIGEFYVNHIKPHLESPQGLCNVVLEGCIFQYILYWRDASFNTSRFCIGEMVFQYIRLLYWRNASFSTFCIGETLGFCIGGMHLSVH